MLSLLSLTRRWLCTAALTLLALVSPAAHAALTSLADEPLATQAGLASAAPNLLFVLDDSGSMDWFYMPDAIWYENWYGYTSPQCNGVAYDPTQTYTPPVKWNGTPTRRPSTPRPGKTATPPAGLVQHGHAAQHLADVLHRLQDRDVEPG